MARTIKNLNTEYQSYLSNNVRENKSLNRADLSIAGYLVYLEEVRKDAASNGNNNNDFIFVSYDKIRENTNIQSRDTISKSLTKLKAFHIILKSQQGRYTEGKSNQYWINPQSLKSSENASTAIATNYKTPSTTSSTLEDMMMQIREMQAMLDAKESQYNEAIKHNSELVRMIEELKKNSPSGDPHLNSAPDFNSVELALSESETAYIEVLGKTVPILTKKEDRLFYTKQELQQSFQYEGRMLADLNIKELKEEIIYRVQHRLEEYFAVRAYQNVVEEEKFI